MLHKRVMQHFESILMEVTNVLRNDASVILAYHQSSTITLHSSIENNDLTP
jgi:hypothetical protein